MSRKFVIKKLRIPFRKTKEGRKELKELLESGYIREKNKIK